MPLPPKIVADLAFSNISSSLFPLTVVDNAALPNQTHSNYTNNTATKLCDSIHMNTLQQFIVVFSGLIIFKGLNYFLAACVSRRNTSNWNDCVKDETFCWNYNMQSWAVDRNEEFLAPRRRRRNTEDSTLVLDYNSDGELLVSEYENTLRLGERIFYTTRWIYGSYDSKNYFHNLRWKDAPGAAEILIDFTTALRLTFGRFFFLALVIVMVNVEELWGCFAERSEQGIPLISTRAG